MSNVSIKSKLSTNDALDSIKGDETDAKDNDSTNPKKISYSKCSFSDSVDTISEPARDPDECEVEDTFDEETSSSIRRHRRLRKSRLRWVPF